MLPSASLHSLPFLPLDEERIVAAAALVFPSPFAVKASFSRCLALRSAASSSVPLLAVIGKGSHQALVEEIAASGRAKDSFHVIANTIEPFDAEHLAPILRQALDDLFLPSGDQSSLAFNVVLLQGDKTNNDVQVWQSWLAGKSDHRGVTVSEVLAYANRENETYASDIRKTTPSTWCNNKSVVYFSSSSSVRSFANALNDSIGGRFSQPLALTIHPKISQEVQLHLGWKVVELSVGPQALLNWLSQNAKQL